MFHLVNGRKEMHLMDKGKEAEEWIAHIQKIVNEKKQTGWKFTWRYVTYMF